MLSFAYFNAYFLICIFSLNNQNSNMIRFSFSKQHLFFKYQLSNSSFLFFFLSYIFKVVMLLHIFVFIQILNSFFCKLIQVFRAICFLKYCLAAFHNLKMLQQHPLFNKNKENLHLDYSHVSNIAYIRISVNEILPLSIGFTSTHLGRKSKIQTFVRFGFPYFYKKLTSFTLCLIVP